jgi:hypothetical protein
VIPKRSADRSFREPPNGRTLERPNAFQGDGCLTSTRYLAAYAFRCYAASGVYAPYITPFRRHLGFSPARLGFLNSISPAMADFGPLLWTAWALAAVATVLPWAARRTRVAAGSRDAGGFSGGRLQ